MINDTHQLQGRAGLAIGPILTWIILQLISLALGAAGTPLWAHHPMPGESLATAEMMVWQITTVTLLAPLLLPTPATAAAIAAIAWPFLQLAGLLDSTSQQNLLWVSVYVAMWIGGLAALMQAAPQPKWRSAVVAGLGCFCLGGPVLLYLRGETLRNGAGDLNLTAFGPVCAATELLVADAKGVGSIWIWTVAAVPAIVALGCTTISHIFRGRR